MSEKKGRGKKACGRQSRAVIIAVAISSLTAILISVPVAAVALDRPIGQAIQFGIGSNFHLNQFDGATIAYLHYREHDRAWRASADINLSYDSRDITVDESNDYKADSTFDEPYWNQSVSAGFECLWYRGEEVSTFLGFGPRVSFSSYHYEGWGFDTYDNNWWHERDTTSDLGVGVRGCLGIQWVATKWLAIHAEYDAEALYHRRVDKWHSEEIYSGRHDNHTTTSNGLTIGSLGVRFGLSAYF